MNLQKCFKPFGRNNETWLRNMIVSDFMSIENYESQSYQIDWLSKKNFYE